jgi:hypothetical protein
MSQAHFEKVMSPGGSLEHKHHRSGGLSVWSVVGGAALLVLAAAVLVNLPDIKRYIKISTM